MGIGSPKMTATWPLLLLLILGAVSPTCTAATLWYNGDWDGVSALGNERNTQVTQSRVYDDFVVTDPAGWDIDRIFSNDFVTPNISFATADFEIRRGLSAGNSGVLVASGVGLSVTQTALGTPNPFGLDLVTFAVSGLAIHLDPGVYWLSFTPVDNSSGRSFLATTSGANAVGTPAGNNDNAFWDSAFFGQNFSNTVTAEGTGLHDFSEGIDGRVSAGTVPEPATLVLLIAGFTGLAFFGAENQGGRLRRGAEV